MSAKGGQEWGEEEGRGRERKGEEGRDDHVAGSWGRLHNLVLAAPFLLH